MRSDESAGKTADAYIAAGTHILEVATLRGIEVGVNAAMDYLAEERKNARRSRQDRRLRNTRLLLKNYRLFKKHVEGAPASAATRKPKESAIDILDSLDSDMLDDSFYVEGIKKSQQRTAIVLAHIDETLRYYKISCEESGKPEDIRRYETLRLLFIVPERHTYQQVAEVMNVDVSTVYKDVNHAIKPLSALIFGIDSARLD